jgi:hypothetical protein
MSAVECPRPPKTVSVDVVKCDIILVQGTCIDARHYIVTCWDSESGTILGARLFASGPDGQPPRPTLGDLVAIMGGTYRYAAVRVDIEARTVKRKTSRIARSLRRLHSSGALKGNVTANGPHTKRSSNSNDQ